MLGSMAATDWKDEVFKNWPNTLEHYTHDMDVMKNDITATAVSIL